MQLRRVEIIKYRNFENIVIDFEKSNFPNVFSIASKNGGGKSTLLQFIFIMLHCFMDENKKKYIQNILEEFNLISTEIELVKFSIIENNIEYELKFIISQAENLEEEVFFENEFEEPIISFDLYLELKNISNNLIKLQKEYEEDRYNNLFFYKNEENEGKSLLLKRKRNIDYLQLRHEDIKSSIKVLEKKLEEKNLSYVSHLENSKNILFLSTSMPKKLQVSLTKKIFLTAPISQVFLFLSKKEKYDIFNEFQNNSIPHQSYFDNIKKSKNDLDGFFTYDFASTELILKSFKKAVEEDAKIIRKTEKYGSNYKDLKDELKIFLDGKEISENIDGNKIIFKSKNTGEELAPEDLSHGELKKLGIYIWLKYIVEEESIVLIDEIDIALHPKWQYEIVQDLNSWSKNSQFLLATHSPQIIGSTYYKNIIKLDNGEIKRFNKPPVDRDINTIITQIMEADDFPVDLLILHKKYRKLINEGKIKTEEAKKLKEEILEYESENSSFFQEINFDLELM